MAQESQRGVSFKTEVCLIEVKEHTPDIFLACCVACLPQGDDDWQHLLHDLSSSPTLPESTALIWGSSEEVGAEARPDSSCSGSILQPDSPSDDSARVSAWLVCVGGWVTPVCFGGAGLWPCERQYQQLAACCD
jgi:hypothetical protein